jgi:uncharacterized damage-inducible protein DinB
MQSHFTMMAGYNRWANGRLYDTARGLSDADYRSDRGAFFRSLHGTLNHLLVADRVWMRRFTGGGPVHTRLDEILFDDLSALALARQEEDERIIAYVDQLAETDLAAKITYRMLSNPRAKMTQPLVAALAHFFNHQTHHRGQAHALVTQIAGNEAMPSLDLIQFQRATGDRAGLG